MPRPPFRKAYHRALHAFGGCCVKCRSKENLDIFPKKGTQYVLRKLADLTLKDYYNIAISDPKKFRILCRWCYAIKKGKVYITSKEKEMTPEEWARKLVRDAQAQDEIWQAYSFMMALAYEALREQGVEPGDIYPGECAPSPGSPKYGSYRRNIGEYRKLNIALKTSKI